MQGKKDLHPEIHQVEVLKIYHKQEERGKKEDGKKRFITTQGKK